MTVFFLNRHPLRNAILLALIPILFAVASGVISVVGALNDTQTLIAQTVSFGLSILLGILLMKKSKLGYRAYGFRALNQKTNPAVFYFLPLLVAEILPFLNGFNNSLSFLQIGLVLLFTVFVGINEELYFRGLVFKVLRTKGVKYAVIMSSVLFGAGHAFTALGGSEPLYVVILIIFAGLFGLVCAEIVVITGSIIPVIVWHALHDFIANVTLESMGTLSIALVVTQTLILCIYAVLLWRKLGFRKAAVSA